MGIAKDVLDIGEKVLRSARRRREHHNVEKVLSVMTPLKNWNRRDLAKLANVSDEDTLQALHTMKDEVESTRSSSPL